MAVTLTLRKNKVRAEPYADDVYRWYVPSDSYEKLIIGKVLDEQNTEYDVNDIILFDSTDAKRIVQNRTPGYIGDTQYVVHENDVMLKFTG